MEPTRWLAFHYDLERAASDLAGCRVRLVSNLGPPWSYLMAALYAVLAAVTRGKFDRRAHQDRFAQTFGRTIRLPDHLSLSRAWSVIPHEARHVWQMRRAGLGWTPLGVITFGLAYVLAPLPCGLALFRAWAELDADGAEWRYRLRTASRERYELVAEAIEQRAVEFAGIVAGAAYGWTLPAAWLRRWYLRHARTIIAAERRI